MWRDRRRLIQLTAAAWLLLAIVVWNVRFDHAIRMAGWEYLEQQASWTRGERPRPRMNDVMQPAALRGALDATAWAALVLSVGLGALAWASQRTSIRPPGP